MLHSTAHHLRDIVRRGEGGRTARQQIEPGHGKRRCSRSGLLCDCRGLSLSFCIAGNCCISAFAPFARNASSACPLDITTSLLSRLRRSCILRRLVEVWHVLRRQWHLVKCHPPVHEHVCVGGGRVGHGRVRGGAPVGLHDPCHGDVRDAAVIEVAPLPTLQVLDIHKVVPATGAATVHQHCVQLIHKGAMLHRHGLSALLEVLIALIAARGRHCRYTSRCHGSCPRANLGFLLPRPAGRCGFDICPSSVRTGGSRSVRIGACCGRGCWGRRSHRCAGWRSCRCLRLARSTLISAGWLFRCTLSAHPQVHVEKGGKGDFVIQLHTGKGRGGVVQVEALQLQGEQVRWPGDLQSLHNWHSGAAQLFKLHRVLATDELRGDEPRKGLFNAADGLAGTKGLDDEGQVHEGVVTLPLHLHRTEPPLDKLCVTLLARFRELFSKALKVCFSCCPDVVGEGAFEQVVHCCGGWVARSTQGALQGIQQHPHEFLHIMLLKRLSRGPLKGLCKRPGRHGGAAGQLQHAEELLQLQRDAVLFLSFHLLVVHPRIDEAAKLRGHEQRLQERIHVAGGALISKASETTATGRGRSRSALSGLLVFGVIRANVCWGFLLFPCRVRANGVVRAGGCTAWSGTTLRTLRAHTIRLHLAASQGHGQVHSTARR